VPLERCKKLCPQPAVCVALRGIKNIVLREGICKILGLDLDLEWDKAGREKKKRWGCQVWGGGCYKGYIKSPSSFPWEKVGEVLLEREKNSTGTKCMWRGVENKITNWRTRCVGDLDWIWI